MEPWHYFLPVAVFGTCSQAAMAQSNPRVAVDLSVSGAAETNPFLQPDGDTAISGRIQIDPRITFDDETSSTRLEGNFRLSQYSRRYGTDEAARIVAASEKRLNERSRAHAQLAVQSSRNAIEDALRASEGDLLDAIDPEADINLDLPPIDTTIAGTRSRVTSLAGTIGLESSVSALSSLGSSLSYNQSWFGNDLGFDYSRYGGQIAYSRQLSERTGLTLGATAGYVDYLGARQGDSLIIEPEIGIQRSLSDRTSFSVGIGASYVNSKDRNGGSSDEVFLAGSTRLCTRRALGAMCFSAQRSAQPTALGGVTAVSSVAVNYDKRLSRASRLSLGARYAKTERGDERWLDATLQATEIVVGSASYYRGLSDRISAFGTAGIAKVFDDVQERQVNASVTIGLSMRIGSLR